MYRRLLLAALVSLGIAGCGCVYDPSVPPPPAKATTAEIKIAAAADLKFALEEVLAAFHESQQEVQATVVHGSSGQLYSQLANDAPFDVFLSADMQYPRQLLEQNLAIPDSNFLYAHGHLVIWVANDSPLEVNQGFDVLLDPSIQKIAIANPKFAPYGRAAEAALKGSDLYAKIENRLVLGENITQTAQFVESGAADVGLIALSLALAPAMQDKGRYWRVPDGSFPPLEQGGVIMQRCEQPAAAQRFCDFFRSEAGGTILLRYGFALPEE